MLQNAIIGVCRYALEKDIDGHTPLILLLSTTCDYTNDDAVSVDSIKAFCTYAPESISICDNLKQSPLHQMCGHMCRRGAVEHQSNLEIIKLLLLTDPSLANAKNSDGETALDNLWKSCVDRGADAPCGYFWTVVELILSASSSSSSCCCSNNETTPNGGSILHQLVSYPECCDTMLDYAIGCNPDSLLDSTDELGNTVLHRAILTNNRNNASIISILIRRAPSLVLRLNWKGDLPIQLASKWNSGELEVLLQLYPRTVELVDLLEIHYPRLLANVKETQTIFQILRIKPSLVQHQ